MKTTLMTFSAEQQWAFLLLVKSESTFFLKSYAFFLDPYKVQSFIFAEKSIGFFCKKNDLHMMASAHAVNASANTAQRPSK